MQRNTAVELVVVSYLFNRGGKESVLCFLLVWSQGFLGSHLSTFR